jgi:hypothetical protein
VRDSQAPPAWTLPYEQLTWRPNLTWDEDQDEVSDSPSCQKLCESLLAAKSDVPMGDFFSRSRLLEILELARYRNSARIARDVTPLLVPSPELLCIDG